jgi:hypothetical protein
MARVILFAFFSFAIASNSWSQERFQRVYGGDGYDTGAEVIELADSSYLIAGTTGSYDPGMSSQIMLLKTNQTGHAQWTVTYGEQFADVAESMVEATDGNFLIAGYTETIENSYQVYALKVTPVGDTIWTRTYGGPQWDFCHQAVALNDGGFALLGQTYSYGSGEGDFYLLRLNADGDTLWTKTYGGTEDESGEAISLTNDGGFYLSGNTESFGAGKQDVYMIRTDAMGDTIWTRTMGGVEDDVCNGACTTSAGNLVIVGGTYNNSPDEFDFLIHRRGANGNSLNTSMEDGSADEFWTDVLEDSNNQLMVVGWVNDSQWGKTDFLYRRYTLDLNFGGIGTSRGSAEDDKMFDVKTTLDGGYIMVGVTGGFLERFDDVYLHKMDNNGVSDNPELGLEEITVAGETFAVRFAPNPIESESSFIIDGMNLLQQEKNGPFLLKVFDGLGREVVSTQLNDGRTQLSLAHLAPGIHYYQFLSDTELLATGKLVKVGY